MWKMLFRKLTQGSAHELKRHWKNSRCKAQKSQLLGAEKAIASESLVLKENHKTSGWSTFQYQAKRTASNHLRDPEIMTWKKVFWKFFTRKKYLIFCLTQLSLAVTFWADSKSESIESSTGQYLVRGRGFDRNRIRMDYICLPAVYWCFVSAYSAWCCPHIENCFYERLLQSELYSRRPCRNHKRKFSMNILLTR